MEPNPGAAEADRLSSLPAELRDEILVRLDHRDAVRTSVLSRTWRHFWKSVSVISLSFPSGTQPSVVDSVLLPYIGPRVSLFDIRVDDACADRFDDWLVALSRCRVESIHVYGQLSSDYFDLQSSIFSFGDLVSLRLLYCYMSPLPVGFAGFPALQKLVLITVDFPYDDGGNDLEAIISRSPLLHTLELSDVLGVRCLIEAPNLRSLTIYLDSDFFHAWRFGELPCLEDADINLSLCPPHEPDYGGFLARFANVQKLTLFLPVEGVEIEIPYTLPASFYNLKKLELSMDFTEMDPVLFMFTLLRSCHNIQNLEIKLRRGGVDQSFEADLNAQWTDDMCAKLQVLRMIDIAWLPNEISFMKLMLSKARLLRTLYVDRLPDLFGDSLADLLKWKRASAQARVMFKGFVQQY